MLLPASQSDESALHACATFLVARFQLGDYLHIALLLVRYGMLCPYNLAFL